MTKLQKPSPASFSTPSAQSGLRIASKSYMFVDISFNFSRATPGMAELRPLPPDVRFELLPRTEEAIRFSFEVKKDAMGPHIAARWGWDDALQLHTHRQRFEAKPFHRICKNSVAIGTLSWAVANDHIRFGEFYLLERYRGAGLGTLILRHALAEADALGLPVRLEYLKWNPVGSLYRRHGFVDSHVSETHFHLVHPVPVRQ
jgi:GNAT superfamily N-acetyltransferase